MEKNKKLMFRKLMKFIADEDLLDLYREYDGISPENFYKLYSSFINEVKQNKNAITIKEKTTGTCSKLIKIIEYLNEDRLSFLTTNEPSLCVDDIKKELKNVKVCMVYADPSILSEFIYTIYDIYKPIPWENEIKEKGEPVFDLTRSAMLKEKFNLKDNNEESFWHIDINLNNLSEKFIDRINHLYEKIDFEEKSEEQQVK